MAFGIGWLVALAGFAFIALGASRNINDSYRGSILIAVGLGSPFRKAGVIPRQTSVPWQSAPSVQPRWPSEQVLPKPGLDPLPPVELLLLVELLEVPVLPEDDELDAALELPAVLDAVEAPDDAVEVAELLADVVDDADELLELAELESVAPLVPAVEPVALELLLAESLELEEVDPVAPRVALVELVVPVDPVVGVLPLQAATATDESKLERTLFICRSVAGDGDVDD